ncbi:hypothetical protein BK005_02140 [bacterium CG10_37_50]|nr:MAG: hypothetical protein BK005_02140 [bacterium CG10_37_50]
MKFLPANLKLELLGEGPERTNLENLVRDNHLESRVTFRGFILSEQLATYYSSALVFVRPSLSEGLGNAFLEAMAYGLPVLGTNVGGIKDFLVDNQTGFVCRPMDPEHLASRLKFILDPVNQTLVATVVSQAKVLVEEKYNWVKIALRFNHLLSSLCLKNP